MIDRLISRLYGGADGGISFQYAFVGLSFLLACIVITMKLIRPALQTYKASKMLESIATNPKIHWFYGHLKFFGKTPHERAEAVAGLSKFHPMMFNFWRGPLHSSLVLFHPFGAKAFLSSGAPKDEFGYKFLRPWLGDGLLTSKGEKWKRHRMLLTPAFHFSILKPYMKISNETSRVLINKWKTKTKQPLDVTNDISMMTLDTMVQCAMSTETNCQLTEGDHPYIKAVKDVARSMVVRFQNPLMMVDWIFRLSKQGKIFYNGVDILHSHADKLIVDRQKVLENRSVSDEAANGSERRMVDFLDILLQAKDESGEGLTNQEIRDEVDTFLFEGHDTTSSGLSWAIYNLAKFPKFQEKCREEVESICRDQEDVEWEDLNHMTYLTMFLKESMRLYPPVSAIGRRLEHPLKIVTDLNSSTESTLPAGTNLTLSISALHQNPLVWENPKEFDPKRFSKENCAKRNPHAYLPFSASSRNCIGQNFAMNEMKVVLAQILRSFNLYLDEETPEPKKEQRLILQSENGTWVKLKPL